MNINRSKMKLTLNVWILYLTFLSLTLSLVKSEDICNISGCACTTNSARDDLKDVLCQCQPNQAISLGPADASGQVAVAPDTTVQLSIIGCERVEILSKTFNAMPMLQNVTFQSFKTLDLHTRLYEARVGNGQAATIGNFEIEDIQELVVHRHTFEGVRVDGTFMLKNVIVQQTPSLAFAFDSIKEFSIFRSRFDRVSMWGFKLDDCMEFNALGESRFFSLASQAFHMKCNKFMLAYNTFDNMQDASLSVTYGFADIQGNTFEKLTGKPFVDLRPLSEIDSNANQAQQGFIFRENKFACEPSLPFNAMAMPSYDKISAPRSYVVIENNHFVCKCDKMAWFIAAMTHNFDRDVIANGRGSLEFLQKLYDSAGQCLTCGLRRCDVIDEESFHDFARNALIVHKNELKCSASGQALKSQNPDRQLNMFKGEEESLAESTNMGLNQCSMLCSPKFVTSIIVALLAIKIIV